MLGIWGTIYILNSILNKRNDYKETMLYFLELYIAPYIYHSHHVRRRCSKMTFYFTYYDSQQFNFMTKLKNHKSRGLIQMSQTIVNIYEKMTPLIGKEYKLPITKNKGLPGYFLEDLLGIPHTRNCLDCVDGELKIFPVKKLKNGKLVPKETIAVTMLSTDELRENDFNTSKCCKKITRMLIVPYYRNGDNIRFLQSSIVDRSAHTEMYTTIENDYNTIRQQYIEHGILQSKTGMILQNRTKGAGHGSTSRAFYLRKEFLKCIPLSL